MDPAPNLKPESKSTDSEITAEAIIDSIKNGTYDATMLEVARKRNLISGEEHSDLLFLLGEKLRYK